MSDIKDEAVVWVPTASPNGSARSILKTFDTANATQAPALSIAIADETTVDVQVKVVGRAADGRQFSVCLHGTWSRINGAVTELRNAAPTFPLAGNPGGWAAVLDFSGTNARVLVTGAAALTIRWSILASAQVVSLDATPPASNPLTIFGAALKGWLNENLTNIATGVWVDESTAAPVSTTQTNAAKRPVASTINGHNAVLFDGTDDGLNWGGDRELLTGDFTIAAVIQTSTIGVSRMVLSKIYGAISWYLGSTAWGTSNKLAGGANSDVATAFAESNSALNNGTPHVLVAVRDGSTMKIYVDGVLQTDTGTNASAITNGSEFIAVGCAMSTSEGATAYHFNGKIGQPIMVNRKPTVGELADLHTYLLGWAGL